MAGVSPSSSPRLPSPPPMAEDQIGPKSPIATLSEEQGKPGGSGHIDHGASRRIRPGTKAADMAEGPPLVELTEIDSAFQLTEHLKALHNSYVHPPNSDTSVPIDRAAAVRLAQPPDRVDKALWLYELCRFLSQKANSITIALFADEPPCSAQTCPEMRASEWQYLCAVHDPPKSCCAIDYCCHTLDWAANTLTSPKHFPSRLALGTEATTAHQQVRQLTNIFRRVYRIFAHAWFQHRDMFWKVESKTGLYVLFKTVCDMYNLIPEDNYTIPPEAEGIETTPTGPQVDQPHVLRREDQDRGEDGHGTEAPTAENTTVATGNTTKRHRQTPSVGATAVSTVIEEVEEEEDPRAGEAELGPQSSKELEREGEPERSISEEQPEFFSAQDDDHQTQESNVVGEDVSEDATEEDDVTIVEAGDVEAAASEEVPPANAVGGEEDSTESETRREKTAEGQEPKSDAQDQEASAADPAQASESVED